MDQAIPPPPPLSPSAIKKAGWRTASILTLLLCLALIVEFMTAEVASISIHKDQFVAIGSFLPTISQWVISFQPDQYRIIGGVLFVALLAKEFLPNKKATALVNTFTALALIALVWVVNVGMSLPMIPIIRGLQAR